MMFNDRETPDEFIYALEMWKTAPVFRIICGWARKVYEELLCGAVVRPLRLRLVLLIPNYAFERS